MPVDPSEFFNPPRTGRGSSAAPRRDPLGEQQARRASDLLGAAAEVADLIASGDTSFTPDTARRSAFQAAQAVGRLPDDDAARVLAAHGIRNETEFARRFFGDEGVPGEAPSAAIAPRSETTPEALAPVRPAAPGRSFSPTDFVLGGLATEGTRRVLVPLALRLLGRGAGAAAARVAATGVTEAGVAAAPYLPAVGAGALLGVALTPQQELDDALFTLGRITGRIPDPTDPENPAFGPTTREALRRRRP